MWKTAKKLLEDGSRSDRDGMTDNPGGSGGWLGGLNRHREAFDRFWDMAAIEITGASGRAGRRGIRRVSSGGYGSLGRLFLPVRLQGTDRGRLRAISVFWRIQEIFIMPFLFICFRKRNPAGICCFTGTMALREEGRRAGTDTPEPCIPGRRRPPARRKRPLRGNRHPYGKGREGMVGNQGAPCDRGYHSWTDFLLSGDRRPEFMEQYGCG